MKGERQSGIDDAKRIDILLAEYAALYELVTYRMTAMDRRLPVVSGTLAALLGSLTIMPDEFRLVFLLGLPAALAALMLTTSSHGMSKEDHLRRIDEIERHVNAIAGEDLLLFQSCHPKKTSAGTHDRTASGTVSAIVTACGIMLAACSFIFHLTVAPSLEFRVAYHAYVAGTALYLVRLLLLFRSYRYRRQPSDSAPIALASRPLTAASFHRAE